MPEYITLNGRVATEEEAEARTVIFYVPDDRSLPYTFATPLPVTARIVLASKNEGFPEPGTPVRIIQAELVDGKDVVLGFVREDAADHADGNVGICMLQDVELVDTGAR